jgi:hypothetical protein
VNNPIQLYPVMAQMGAAFAGFGSLASGLGRRSGGDDARVDASRLSTMLFSSLSLTLLGLLPVVLTSLSLDEEAAVRGSAIAALLTIVAYAPSGASRSYRIRHSAGFSRIATAANLACVLTAVTGFALCAAGRPPSSGLYLLGLSGMLASSIVMFSRVIRSMLRPHSSAEEAPDPLPLTNEGNDRA